MSHAALTLIAGVNQNRTPAMNTAAISSCNLIRFIPDQQLGGIPQKLGGWTKVYPNAMGSTTRALWAWADINDVYYLAVGAEESLSVISYGSGGTGTPALMDISPAEDTNNVTVDVTTTSGSSTVTITDPGSDITNYDSVFIGTQIAVGGLVLYGLYQCSSVSSNTYTIEAKNALGNPALATSSVANGGAVPTFTTVSASSIVTVTLAAHGYVVGQTFTVFVSLTIAGITLHGDYLITSVPTSSTFTIQASNAANAAAGPTSMNSGLARYLYLIGFGPLPGGTGFGIDGFGVGGFGSGVTPAANPGTPIETTDWSLDNWGGFLIACPREGAIYLWNPLSNQSGASVIPTAPPFNVGAFVAMPQRQIIAWGSTSTGIIDHLLIRWCDVNNYNQWIPLVQNQAGSFRLTRGSKIIGALQGPQQGFVWTDVGLWSMQYVGQPDVYSFNEIAMGCGLVGNKAAGVLDGDVFWMGQSQFYTLGDGGVQSLYCPVWDVIFQDLDTDNLEKIRFAANSRFGEATWYYPTTSSGGEVSNYVKYNKFLQQWDFGAIGRTAWINQSVLGPPIGADADTNFLYQHETSNDADGAAMDSYFQTGYFTLDEGNWQIFIDQVWPDMKWGLYGGVQSANVNITFYVVDYPGQTPRTYGPFTVTQATTYITPRLRGRLVSVRISSDDVGSFWRLGQLRYRTQQDGKY